jgi:2'-5' RNA ligase
VTVARTARLFVAVWPPADVLDQVAALARADRHGVRWTTRDQWHVTLRFVGSADVEATVVALDSVRAPACEAVMSRPAGRLGRNVLVLPVDGLDDVAASVIRSTAAIGQPPDARAFHGHLTLARLRAVPACALVSGQVEARWPVRSVTLVESHLHPDGARYETVHEVALATG